MINDDLEPAEGDYVIKMQGDYTFEGTVVCKFCKLKGETRYVVENKDGLLLIMNSKQLRILSATRP